MNRFTPIALLFSLAACGDPLAKVERFSDVELADESAAQALPSQEELQREGGFFSRLLKPPSQDDAVAAAVASAEQSITDDADPVAETETALAALQPETKPDADVEGGTPLATVEVEVTEVEAPERRGLLGLLTRPAAKEEVVVAVVPITEETAPQEETATQQATAQVEEDTSIAALAASAPTELVEPQKRRGLFARLKDGGEVRTASLSRDISSETTVVRVAPQKRDRVTGSRAGPRKRLGPGVSDVAYGMVVPYGVVARSCEAKGKPLGRKLDKAPARGKGYALYDTAPDSAAPRTFYVTGFADGCPRQFTAALAIFGAPSMHEQLRYGRPSTEYPYSATDKAYERVKSSICGVGKRKPCGAKISQVERNTVFISTYERFGNNAKWADILIHDGAVVASAIKKP